MPYLSGCSGAGGFSSLSTHLMKELSEPDWLFETKSIHIKIQIWVQQTCKFYKYIWFCTDIPGTVSSWLNPSVLQFNRGRHGLLTLPFFCKWCCCPPLLLKVISLIEAEGLPPSLLFLPSCLQWNLVRFGVLFFQCWICRISFFNTFERKKSAVSTFYFVLLCGDAN